MKSKLAVFKQLWREWNQDRGPQLAAALAYYMIFSLAPLLLLLISLLGLFLNDQTAQERILDFVQTNINQDAAKTVQSMMQAVSQEKDGSFTKIFSFILLIFGATAAVGQIQTAFQQIWNRKNKAKNVVKSTIKQRAFSFLLICLVGIFIFLSLLLSTGLTFIFKYLSELIPQIRYALPITEIILSFGLTSFLFALMFKYIPQTEAHWKEVIKGGLFTGFLFFLVKFGLTWYFSAAQLSSTYGVASSVLILLMWIYFCSYILLLGAEYTQILTQRKKFLGLF